MIKSLIFDLDGTLVDSKKEIYSAVKDASELNGWVVPTYNEFAPYLGKTIDVFYTDFLGMTEKCAESAVQLFRQEYSKYCLQSVAFSDVPIFLSNAKEKKLLLGIVTSKSVSLANNVCDKCDLTKYFDVIIGSIDGYVTSKISMIEKCLNRLNVSAKDAIYVGDTLSDFKSSTAANVQFIGVSYGYGNLSGEVVSNTIVVDRLEDIFNKISI